MRIIRLIGDAGRFHEDSYRFRCQGSKSSTVKRNTGRHFWAPQHVTKNGPQKRSMVKTTVKCLGSKQLAGRRGESIGFSFLLGKKRHVMGAVASKASQAWCCKGTLSRCVESIFSPSTFQSLYQLNPKGLWIFPPCNGTIWHPNWKVGQCTLFWSVCWVILR